MYSWAFVDDGGMSNSFCHFSPLSTLFLGWLKYIWEKERERVCVCVCVCWFEISLKSQHIMTDSYHCFNRTTHSLVKRHLAPTSTIFICHVWKPPYVSQSDCVTQAGEDKLNRVGPLSSIGFEAILDVCLLGKSTFKYSVTYTVYFLLPCFHIPK